ncbi:hypothetical protein CK203_095617 [Vitis vinifera]|uniref:Uncharacterized protein n=1 Tax=Vitis vinifera TaxID=29760 RepID=A0A438FGV7_VITVI|nr:hypothetical protein CK203_095617 [Vitis vinifera]
MYSPSYLEICGLNNALSAKCCAFTTNLDRIQIPKKYSRSLGDSKMERGSDGRNKGIGKKWDLGSDEFAKRKKPVSCKWVFTVKYTTNGTVRTITKPAWLQRGSLRPMASTYTETFAPNNKAEHYTTSFILGNKPRLATPSV